MERLLLPILTVSWNVGAKFVRCSPGVTVPLPTQSCDPADLVFGALQRTADVSLLRRKTQLSTYNCQPSEAVNYTSSHRNICFNIILSSMLHFSSMPPVLHTLHISLWSRVSLLSDILCSSFSEFSLLLISSWFWFVTSVPKCFIVLNRLLALFITWLSVHCGE